MTNFMCPHPDFINMQPEMAYRSITVLQSSQCSALETLENPFLPRVKISIHGGKHQDVTLSSLTLKKAFPLISVEIEILLRSPEDIIREYLQWK